MNGAVLGISGNIRIFRLPVRLSSHIWPVSVKMTGRKRIGLEPARRPRTGPPRIGTTDSGAALHIGTVINSGRIRYFTYHLRIQ